LFQKNEEEKVFGLQFKSG